MTNNKPVHPNPTGIIKIMAIQSYKQVIRLKVGHEKAAPHKIRTKMTRTMKRKTAAQHPLTCHVKLKLSGQLLRNVLAVGPSVIS
jgi:hypothetical protein